VSHVPQVLPAVRKTHEDPYLRSHLPRELPEKVACGVAKVPHMRMQHHQGSQQPEEGVFGEVQRSEGRLGQEDSHDGSLTQK